MSNKKLYIALTMALLVFSFPQTSHGATDFNSQEFPFDQGKEFRRGLSPVFLRSEVVTLQEGNKMPEGTPPELVQMFASLLSRTSPGFGIYTFDEDSTKRALVGYIVTTTSFRMQETTEVSWFRIFDAYQKKGYGAEAFRTLMGILKAKGKGGFTPGNHLFLSVAQDNKWMLKIALHMKFQILDISELSKQENMLTLARSLEEGLPDYPPLPSPPQANP